MIRFSLQYGPGAVELFHEKQPDELMGKGQSGEGTLFIGTCVYLAGKTIGPPDDENQMVYLPDQNQPVRITVLNKT